MTVKVVTDSTSDIPLDLARQLEIAVVPLYVHFGADVFKDGVDISADEFYRRLTTGKVLPKTAAPSPGDFVETYRRLCAEGHEVVSVHISSKLSATYSSALLGKEQAGKDCRIEVVDSQQAAMGLGLLAIETAKLAQNGAKQSEITKWLEQTVPRAHLLGLVPTLEYLQKGGRIGKASAFLGGILQIKPIIGVAKGEVHPFERVRTTRKALECLAEMASAYKAVQSLALIGSTDELLVDDLGRQLKEAFPGVEPYRSRFGPVIGTYTGPGAVGVALIEA